MSRWMVEGEGMEISMNALSKVQCSMTTMVESQEEAQGKVVPNLVHLKTKKLTSKMSIKLIELGAIFKTLILLNRASSYELDLRI